MPNRTRSNPLVAPARLSLRFPRTVIALWTLAVIAAVPAALRSHRVAQGGSEAIRGSEAQATLAMLDGAFGRGFSQPIPVVLTHATQRTEAAEFAREVSGLADRLAAAPGVRAVVHPWNSGLPELVGRDGQSVLLLVQRDVATLAEAEARTAALRDWLQPPRLPPDFRAIVTGMSSTYHDLNHQSAADLLRAEMVGVPVTLLVLFLVFRTVWAAGLALTIAVVAVALSSGALWVLSPWLPVSVLAQNVITMIGLGAGTDYALFYLSHLREERAYSARFADAIVAAMGRTAPAVSVAGLAVGSGFAALFLVRARFVHSLATGGLIVIALAVTATLTLLPALLSFCGDRVFSSASGHASPAAADGNWSRWARVVMRRPWVFLAVALIGSGCVTWPALRTRGWSVGPNDLPPTAPARVGADLLASHFETGWLAPVAIAVHSHDANGLWSPAAQAAILSLAEELRRDARVTHVLGFPRVLAVLGEARHAVHTTEALPPALQGTAATAVSADGRTAVILVVTREGPNAPATLALVDTLRQRRWPKDVDAPLELRVGGGAALIRDFDHEMFSSVRRVMLVVVGITFGLLLAYFRSVVVPLKAVAANLLSVTTAYGFIVLVFQDGHGARWLGFEPPGGLHSFVVLMLFTILFGLSMDYEVFLLSRMRDEYRDGADNTAAVARGLAGTAGIISSAAAIMVCLFGSFGFFGLTASRQFGLGLAFAVAFDATVVRLLIVPATMRLLGKWNWWVPGWPQRTAHVPAPERAPPSETASLRPAAK